MRILCEVLPVSREVNSGDPTRGRRRLYLSMLNHNLLSNCKERRFVGWRTNSLMNNGREEKSDANHMYLLHPGSALAIRCHDPFPGNWATRVSSKEMPVLEHQPRLGSKTSYIIDCPNHLFHWHFVAQHLLQLALLFNHRSAY